MDYVFWLIILGIALWVYYSNAKKRDKNIILALISQGFKETSELPKSIEYPKVQSSRSDLLDYAKKLFDEEIKTILEENPGILQKELNRGGIDTSVCSILERYGYLIRRRKGNSFALYLSNGANIGVYRSSDIRIRLREQISCEVYSNSKKMIIDYFGFDFLKNFLEKEYENTIRNNPYKVKEWKKNGSFGRPDSCLYNRDGDNFLTSSIFHNMGDALRFDMNAPLVRIVDKYWTKQCDKALKKFYETYGFFATNSFINSELPKIIGEERLLSFYKELKERASSLYVKWTHLGGYWYSLPSDYILLYYAKHLRFKWGIKPKIIEKKCLYCGNQFFPTGSSYSLDKVIKYYPIQKSIEEINFCDKHFPPKAYLMLDFEESVKGYDDKIIKERMISLLKELVDILGFIPPRNFHNIIYLKELPKEKFEQAIICINKMPLYENINVSGIDYKTIFGSWIQVLSAAGILEGEVRKTRWGYMCEAKDSHFCRSIGEKIIDDFLYEHNIPHEREPHYPGERQYRADWKIGRYFIEFWGLKGGEDYDRKIEQKKAIAQKYGIPLIEITFSDLRKLEEKFNNLII